MLLPIVSLLVVAAVVAVVVLAGHTSAGPSSATGARPVTLIYRAEPTPAQPQVTPRALERTASIIRSRARQLGVSHAQIHTRGTNEIVVKLAAVQNLSLAENALGSNAEPEFYDWEANVLLPSGKSAASQLPLQNPAAVRLSQGSSSATPGSPSAGGLPLYDAVKLASRQRHARLSRSLSRLGDEYYLFGAPGSSACAAAAKAAITAPTSGQHCYLAGPEQTMKKLRSEPLPANVSFSDGHALAVPQGWSVLQAANPEPTVLVSPTSATARFFVLRDGPALYGNQILSAKPIRLNNGQADLHVRFTAAGAQAFQELTSTLAHRGQQVSTANAVLDQHFAVESGGQLQTVLRIDFTKYPDGVVSRAGSAYVQGPFAPRSARKLATELTYQPLRLLLVGKPSAAR